MRVIRPASLHPAERRRHLLLGLTMFAAGILAARLALLLPGSPLTGAMAGAAAIGLGVGAAWTGRALRSTRARRLAQSLMRLVSSAFDDAYTLVLAPRLPVRDSDRLDGILVGPGGIRVLTVRDWEGSYRVRGRVWEFDAGKRRGWIRCRTNPSLDAIALATAVSHWAVDAGLGELPIRAVVAFPDARTRVVLEEPQDEILKSDNAPWWANSIGRVRRVDPATMARVLESILEVSERDASTVVGRRVSGAA